MRLPSQAGCWGSRSRVEESWSAVGIAILDPDSKVNVGTVWSGAAAGALGSTRNAPMVRDQIIVVFKFIYLSVAIGPLLR